jgi:hydroxymethylbilane synthase
VRLGTRGSALALAQAHAVAALLGGNDVEVVTITTTGDRQRALLDKQKWVAELEAALLAGEIDLAVHSAKDVPGELPEGLALVGAPARADPRDALCGAASLQELPEGARVGTSSLRRGAQLRAVRPDLDVAELRGNVDTRLRRLAAGGYDAIVLAAAGLRRLSLDAEIGTTLPELVPAPGQGTIALQARTGDAGARAAAERITDAEAWTALTAERALARGVQASCHTPLGAHARRAGATGRLVLETFAGLPDGSEWLSDRLEGDASEPEGLGAEAAQRLLSAGGADLLRRAEQAGIA